MTLKLNFYPKATMEVKSEKKLVHVFPLLWALLAF